MKVVTSLVSFFQRRLGCSRIQAMVKLVLTLLTLSVAVATVLISVHYYHNSTATRRDRLELLPGDHTVVAAILNGDVLVGRTDFERLSEGNPTFVALGGESVSYFTEIGGIGYRYDLGISDPWSKPIPDDRLRSGGIVLDDPSVTGSRLISYAILAVFTIILLIVFFRAATGYQSPNGWTSIWPGLRNSALR